jgi:hypothetical protein
MNKKIEQSKLTPESLLLGASVASLIAIIIGMVAKMIFVQGINAQIFDLLHLIFGSVFLVTTVIYLPMHFLRILGVRRLNMFLSGVFAALCLIGLVYTSYFFVVDGLQQTYEGLLLTHESVGYIIIGILVIHLLLHGLTFPKRRKQKNKFTTISDVRVTIVVFLGVFCCLAVFLRLLHEVTENPYSKEPAIADYTYGYGDTAFLPSETHTPNFEFIDSRSMTVSHKCASCHQDIAKQWLSSAHRQAASDKSYETNIKLLVANKGIEAARYCEGCHAPIALLSGELSAGGKHGGIDGSPANTEGVNCVSCHSISSVIHTKGVASYFYQTKRPYLFETADVHLLQQINKLAITLDPNQHKQDFAANVLSDPKVCATCHAQFIDKNLNDWGWVKMQDEYSAWLESPFSGMHDATFSSREPQRCQDCHMPLVTSDDPSADENGLVRDHRFVAANTVLPLLNNDQDMLNATISFMQDDRVSINIKPPHRKDATVSNVLIDESLRDLAIQPFYYYKGEKAKLQIIVSNKNVGHNFPGGTIDINQAWVAIQIVDAQGDIVLTSGDIDDQDVLDPNSYIYRALPVDRQGQVVWKHDLFNMVGKASVNIIKSGESDVVEYEFDIPYHIKSPLYVSAQIRYRKFNTKYARWALEDEYQPIPIVDLDRTYLEIPVRNKLEAQSNF